MLLAYTTPSQVVNNLIASLIKTVEDPTLPPRYLDLKNT